MSAFNEAASVQKAADTDANGVSTPRVTIAASAVDDPALILTINRKLDFLIAALTGADPGDFGI